MVSIQWLHNERLLCRSCDARHCDFGTREAAEDGCGEESRPNRLIVSRRNVLLKTG